IISVLIVSGCSGKKAAIEPIDNNNTPPQKVLGTIPPPVAHSHKPVMPIEKVTNEAYEELYSIAVEDFSVQGLLYSLAKNAKLNVDISPDISGIVTLNVIDQTLPMVMERIAKMAHLRFEMDGPTLVVTPDLPYIHTYQINYLNIDRKMSSNLRLSSQISSSGSGVPASDKDAAARKSTPEGRSNILVDNLSENNFWSQLEKNIRSIIERSDNKQKTKNKEEFTTNFNDDIALSRDFQAREQELANTNKEDKKIESSMDLVIVNPQSGLVTVRATSRQQTEVQLFLDKLMAGARRQVRIEATILEVRLDKSHESGIDWTAFRDVSANRPSTNTVIGNNTSTTLATVVNKEDPVASFNITDPISGVANISGVFHNVNIALKLLDQFGDVRVLSSPKLVTLNNQISVLKVVDNLVYFTVEKNERESNSTLITTYTSNVRTVPVGLVMSVLPQISPNGQVSLIVRPTITRVVDFVTDPNPDLANKNIVSRIPQIQVREMESMLSVQSSQTAVIGGLMTSVINDSNNSVPGVSKIPIFGRLFKHKKDLVTNVELVIFLKPTVIKSDVDLLEKKELSLLNKFLSKHDTQEQKLIFSGREL
ncbi:MAG: secretin N-terminal domain-containing protein, partial [Magnetococcales bacterium]|nr:secretin N-terminal domain-containing protein [Magnetococcales bacterium]